MKYSLGKSNATDLRERNGFRYLKDSDLNKLMRIYDIVWKDIYPRALQFSKLFENTFQSADLIELQDGMLHAPIPMPERVNNGDKLIRKYNAWRKDYEKIVKTYSNERERLRWKNYEIEVYSR